MERKLTRASQLKGGRVDKQVALEVNGERVTGVRMKVRFSRLLEVPNGA